EYGMDPGEYFLLMARMEPENNIETILDGYAKSTTKMPILVVGGTVNKFSKHLLAKFGEDKRIIFAGGVYDQWKVHCLRSFCRLYFHGHSTGGTNPSLLEAMAGGALIAAHDNVFNRQVLEGNALYFSGPGDITGLVDRLPAGLDAVSMKKQNLEKILQRYRWPDIIAKYERFILYCLSVQKTNAKDILYRRYSG
ncbi:MAG TPA: glycosyltransferase, partial [Puia sp.]|nr:glycosyltransferase [Puia sp.]